MKGIRNINLSFVALMFFLPATLFSQTVIEVSGVINQNVNWDADTVKVIGNVSVVSGSTVNILPGTIIKFQGHYKLSVLDGVILAVGTETDSIVFTTENIETGWHGVRFYENQSSDTSKFFYCLFEHGMAYDEGDDYDENGGAIFSLLHDQVILSNCTFQNNQAIFGGAIALGNADIIIISCIITHNYASFSAGAIDASYSGIKLINSLLNNNSSGSRGGALELTGTVPLTIVNTSICNNMSFKGGGIFCDASPILKNCILWGNVAGSCGDQVFIQDLWGQNSEPQFFFCNVEGGKESFCLDNYTNPVYEFDYENYFNIDEFPEFTDSTNHNFSLTAISPCINVGTPNSLSLGLPDFDLAGNPRVVDGRIDIGAYEYPYPVLIRQIKEDHILVFPNPAKQIIHIKSPVSLKNSLIEVFSAYGSRVKHLVLSDNSLNIEDLHPGIYILKIRIKDEYVIIKRLVKE